MAAVHPHGEHTSQVQRPDQSQARPGRPNARPMHERRVIEAHIQGATGIVLLDAGRLMVDAEGNLVRVSGPHPQHFGDKFCNALLP